MRLTSKILIAALMVISVLYTTKAQKVQADSLFFSTEIDMADLLPPLDSLLEIGWSKFPQRRLELAQIDNYKWNLDYVKKIWVQNFSTFYTYSQGAALGLLPGGGAVPGLDGGRWGVTLQLSLFDVIGRRGRVNQVKAQVEVAKEKLGVEEFIYKKMVVEQYNDVIGWEKIYKNRMEDVQVQTVNSQIAEKEFKEGASSYLEYARSRTYWADATANMGIARRNFAHALNQLELLVGIRLATIQRKGVQPSSK